MKKIILYIVLFILVILLVGYEFLDRGIDNQKTTIKGEYKPGKGCNGLVNGVEIKTSCEEYKKYSGKVIEVTGIVTESKCSPEFPQCFDGKQMKDIELVKIVY